MTTLKARMQMYPPSEGLLRALQALTSILQHPLLQPPHSLLYIQQHPLLQTTQAVAEGTGFTGMPYPTHGVEPVATEPPMAPSVSEPVASGSSYLLFYEPA